MKIGIDIRNIGKQRTGSESVVLELTKNILELDKKNEYLLLTDTDDALVLENVRHDLNLNDKKNARLISLKAQNKFIWALWTMPKFFLTNKIDIFHTEYILPLFIPGRVKVVTHIHDVSFKVYRQMILKKDLFFLDLLIPRSIRRSDKIIAVSQFTKDEILRFYPKAKNKIEVIFNSINLIISDSSKESREAIREKYNLPEKFILYIGTLQPRKNIPVLIDAYAKIKNEIPGVKLVLAGDRNAHNFDAHIQEALLKNNLSQDVIFPGFIDTKDKAIVCEMAEIFVFPSLYEGFGIPILEAMSVGTPVVASDIAPHREVAGEAALFFNPILAEELATQIKDIVKNPDLHDKLAARGKERSQKFSWRESAERMVAIFKSLD